LRTLEDLYLALTPGDSHLSYSSLGAIDVLARMMTWVLAQPIKALYSLELHLLLSDMQRAEYLADTRAAAVAGTDAVIALHDKLLLESVAVHTVQRVSIDRGDPETLCNAMADSVRAVPSRELARRRRVAALERTKLGATHPPTALRIELLESRPPVDARFVLDAARSADIDHELEPQRRAAG